MWEAWLCQLEVISRGIKRSWFEKEICESPDHKATQQDIFDKRCWDGKIVVIVIVTLCCLPMSPCWWSARRNHSRPVFVTTSSAASCSKYVDHRQKLLHKLLSLFSVTNLSRSGNKSQHLQWTLWCMFRFPMAQVLISLLFSKGLNSGTNYSIMPSTRHLFPSAIFDRSIISL